MIDLPIDIIAHSLDRLLLLALLGGTLFLARRAAVRQAGGMDQLARLAKGLLLCLGLWWIWMGLTLFIGIPRAQWLCPFDRLLQTLTLATVGWLVLGRSTAEVSSGLRWRTVMILAFAVVLPVYLGWAPEWARAMQSRPTAAPPMATARAWDAWQALLALGLAWGLVARRRAAAWPFGIVGGFLVASVLDVLRPLDAAGADFAPVWSRLGLLVIGIVMAAHALQRNWELGLLPGLPSFLPIRPPDPSASAPVASPLGAPSPPGQRDQDLARSVAEQAVQIGHLAGALNTVATRLERLERPAPAESAPDSTLLARLQSYQEALGRLPVGLLLTDARGLLSYANPAAAALLGHAPRSGEPLAESLGAGDATHAALRRLLTGGESRARTDGVHQGGSQLRTDLHALRDADGGIGGILAVLGTDPGSLDTASLALVPELIEALGAPITSIMGYSHLIRQGKGVFQGEGQLERYLERIDANLSQLKVMLANLAMVLDGGGDAWERSQAGEPLDLAERLDQAVERMQHQLREKGLRAERIGEAPGGLLGDGAVVDLLLDNLLVHAIQRSPMGGDVQVAARGDGERLVLEVQDRGRAPEGTVPLPEQPVSLADVTVAVELKAAQLLATRQGGQVWLRPEEGGLRGCASLRVREARLPHQPHQPRPTDD